MIYPAAILAPAALLLPFAATDLPRAAPAQMLAPETAGQAPTAFATDDDRGLRIFLDARQPSSEGQVSIEQRIVVRIAPRAQPSRQDLLSQLPRGQEASRLEERGMGKCVQIQRIAGVGTSSNNRLILFMSDRRIVSARLEKACKPEDFYSGFYVERNDDGMLCVKRDELRSRAGAKCGVDRFHQLVAVRE